MTTTRYISADERSLHESSNPLEQMFIETMRSLGLWAVYQKKTGSSPELVSSELMNGEDAYALLEILREQGFTVNITSALFYPDRYAVVLG